MPNAKILIVDDEPKLRRLLSINLTSLHYEVACAVDGKTALTLFEDFAPDLVLLDVMMPGMSGLDVLCELRQRRRSAVGVILLTARDQIEDKIKGFELGADDYLPKPFALEELFARVAAVIRRTQASSAPTVASDSVVNGPIEIWPHEHRVQVHGREVRLTPNEFRLLAYLTAHVGSVITHEQLIAHVWGRADVEMQALRATLARLRNKLREAGLRDDCAIDSLSGVGYKMVRLVTAPCS